MLLLDDDEAVRSTIAEITAEFGYLCDTAANAKQAVALLRSQPYDCALVDLMLGEDESGLEVLRKVARRAPPPLPPICVITAFHPELVSELLTFDPGLGKIIFGGKAPRVLLKPFRTAELLSVLEEMTS